MFYWRRSPSPLDGGPVVRSYSRLVAIAVLAAACADASAPSGPSRLAPLLEPAGNVTSQLIPNEYIVVLNNNVSDVAGAAAESGVPVIVRWENAIKGYLVSASSAEITRIRGDARVKFVEQNGIMTKDATQSPTPSWGLDRIDQTNLPLNNSYTYPGTASNVHSYTIDTGILLTHTQFTGRIGNGFDAVTPGGTANDCDGHGTHVTGTIGGSTYGVAKGATLHPVRVLGCTGSGSFAQVISGINWVAANRILPAVANMSLGGGQTASVDAATNALVAAGVFTAVSAGNSNDNSCFYSPAAAANATTVGSTTTTDARSSFSNYGTCVDVFAPGSSIFSSYIGSNTATATLSGTSMSSPHVAGVGALILSANPTWTPAQVDAAIKTNASLNKVTNPGTGSPNRLLNMSFLNGGSPGNQAPVARFTVSCNPGVNCTADASTSTDDNGLANLTFQWTNNVGRPVKTGTTATYSYNATNPAKNTFSLTLTATDAGGLTHQVTQSIVIPGSGGGNTAPVANFTITCTPGQCVVDAASSTDDGGFGNLTFNWTNTGGRPSRSGSTATFFFSVSPSKPSAFDVTLTATDAGGLTNAITKAVVIP